MNPVLYTRSAYHRYLLLFCVQLGKQEKSKTWKNRLVLPVKENLVRLSEEQLCLFYI